MLTSQPYGTLFKPKLDYQVSGRPYQDDDKNWALVLIDCQIDFVHKNGVLHVPGAIEDMARIGQFIDRQCSNLKDIYVSLDTHTVFQIFHPHWWVNQNGQHPEPFDVITPNTNEWRPLYQIQQSMQYVKDMKALPIWPVHTLEGDIGRCIDPALFEILNQWTRTRLRDLHMITKGQIQTSDQFGIFCPEQPNSRYPNGLFNHELLDALKEYDRVYVAGEAKSHCVLITLQQMMKYWDEDQTNKIYVLADCTSSVLGFDELADKQLQELAQKGVNLIKSTEV